MPASAVAWTDEEASQPNRPRTVRTHHRPSGAIAVCLLEATLGAGSLLRPSTNAVSRCPRSYRIQPMIRSERQSASAAFCLTLFLRLHLSWQTDLLSPVAPIVVQIRP